MSSSSLPIALTNTVISHPPKTTTTNHASSSHYHYSRSQSHLFPSQPLTLSKPRTIAAVPSTPGIPAHENEPEAELVPEMMPKHVAVIMDGNRRWAKMRGLPTSEGHEELMKSWKRVAKLCIKSGIKVLTALLFTTENWRRSKEEIEFLFKLFETTLSSEAEAIMREGIKFRVIGDMSKLPRSLQKMITIVEENSKNNSRFQFIMAINYGGRYDIVQACKSVAKKVQDDIIHLEDINENIIEKELETEFSNPDLLIRTSGVLRLSNFLLWQLAYTELYFTPQLGPDFGKDEFEEALSSFQQRQRRYGGD
ncbi:unnamed protein product [Vicia faba]|uniref:Alkyl transferase n=1 Tax=Vicia faba TaxID=3906 RepID=A0AAV0YI41_VICFA|nr:unnamed protein product [Vicia faba]